jgi:PAS domain S-box
MGGAKNVGDAFAHHYFFQASYWWVPCLGLALYSICMALYLRPAYRLSSDCPEAEVDQQQHEVKSVVKRFRHLPLFAVALSIALFFFNDALSDLAHHHEQDLEFSAFRALVDCGFGLFLGVLMIFVLENDLFVAKRIAHQHSPELRLHYQSLYVKIFLAVFAITFHFTVQTIAVLPSFVVLEHPMAQLRLRGDAQGTSGALEPTASAANSQLQAGAEQWLRRNADVLFHAAEYGAKDTLDVYFLQLAIYVAFVLLMLRQLKLFIKRPLATIRGRLRDLNKGSPEDLRPIEIVQNDEFAAAFDEINKLIASQHTELAASQERLSHIVASAADPIVVFDEVGSIHLFNPAAEAFFGYGAEEARGLPFCDLIELPADLAKSCGDSALPLINHLCEQGCGPSRHLARRKDGSRRPFEVNIGTTASGAGTLYTAILRDVSAQIAVEEALTQAKLAAEKANRMKSEFLANMSHELRTPLNAVLGFTQLLSGDKNLTGTQLEKINIISRSGEHLLALINDILDLSKIEAGKFETRSETFDLQAFGADLRDMFSLRCQKKGLGLDVEELEGLPRYAVGDLGKLRQVMINLVGNAVKFTDEGGIGIVIGPDGDRVRFSVHDTGRGIPADELELIMQPFTQASTTDHEGGTGLGLTISTRFVEMLGGKLEVESEVGAGSTFSFSIPLEATDQAPGGAEPEIAWARVKGEAAPLVLIVDDKDTNRLILKEMLERAGFATVEAADGAEALDRCKRFAPKLVFMDIKMPVMDGYEAASRIKADPETRKIPLFALTASAFKHDEEKIREAGFDGFLAKPFKRGDLFKIIRDETDIEMEFEVAAAPEAKAERTEPEAAAEVVAALGEAGLAKLEELASINDFTAIGRLADEAKPTLPRFAAALSRYAASFDEAAIAALIASLRAEEERP